MRKIDFEDWDYIEDKEHNFVSVKLLEFDKPNRNGRTYTKESYEDFISKQKDTYGEYVVGENGDKEFSTNLKNVSHLISNYRISENNLYGDINILGTQSGLIVSDIINGGNKIGIASRGYGNVNGDGVVINYKPITFDFVSDPSSDIFLSL